MKLFGTAAALRDEAGIPQSNTDRAYYEPFLTVLQDGAGGGAFAPAWAEGRSMPWQAAMTDVLASSHGTEPPAPAMS